MRVGLGVVDRLRHRAGIDLAERRRLLGDEFDVRLRAFIISLKAAAADCPYSKLG